MNSAQNKTTAKGLQGKEEIRFLDKCRRFPSLVIVSHPNSPQEGFEYIFEKLSDLESERKGPSMMQIRGKRGMLRFFRVFINYGRKLMRGRKKSYDDLESYLLDLEQNGKYTRRTNIEELLNSYPNKDLWFKLQEYAKNKWNIIKIGFTELPTKLIFRNKMVLFRYALVFMQEMNKDKIDNAPGIKAGDETIRIYAELGEAVADIANWLRLKGIRSQAVHPLGGLVCTPPLAGKAGMGGQGMHGILVTHEFGPRQRLAPIFIEEKLFEYTDNDEHNWIEEYCKTCRICQKECPVDAILDKKVISVENIPGIGALKSCIDREKCFPYFAKTLGCSICIKVCPFSNGPETYEKLKNTISQKK
ncbi:MAG: 4Fe-4S binding protein [Candidatus Lokiarchaeota archaeon]|nr:4Fe-4S binding protein [Candidatus Lokiarchaeota archaeon]